MNLPSLSRAIDEGAVRALVTDVDGTLYRQTPVRHRMALRLFRKALIQPRETAKVFRSIHAYRHAQESMRDTCPDCDNLAEEQIRLAAEACRLPEAVVARHVATWMESSPLTLLRSAMRQDVADCLEKARARGLRLAVWSDYPATSKLKALGMERLFHVVVCAQDLDVQRFKPDPRGLEVAVARLGVTKEDTIYIGDRPEVDGLAAVRAGVRHVIVGSSAAKDTEQQRNPPSNRTVNT